MTDHPDFVEKTTPYDHRPRGYRNRAIILSYAETAATRLRAAAANLVHPVHPNIAAMLRRTADEVSEISKLLGGPEW